MKIVASVSLSCALFIAGCGGGGGGTSSASTEPSYTGVVLSEVSAVNASGVLGGHYNNNYAEWIEITNTGTETFDISGCYLTDDLSVQNKWQIPDANILSPGESVRFWADEVNVYDHMNFKVKMKGGKLALYSPSLKLLDSVTYPAQLTDISYGRGTGSNSSNWYFCATPTPGASNSGVMTAASTRTAAPVFSEAPGFKSSAVDVTITADAGTTIRYTTDGSIPTTASTLYTGQVAIAATQVLKARAFADAAMPSLVTVGTYFIGEPTTTLPVVSVSTNPGNLWSSDYGIYVKGPNAEDNPPYYGANFREDWERPAHVELFETDGSRGLCQFTGIKINGNTTQGVPEKSLAFYAKAKYDGNTTFTYELFPEDKPGVTNFPRFLIRNSGQDWPLTLFRDALSARVIKGEMDLDYQAYRPVIHFLNGEYNGVINLREKADQYFAVTNHGATGGKVDFLEYDGATVVVNDGSDAEYTALITYLTDNAININDPTVYATVQTMMDVDEYINYIIAETFCGNFDWPSSNVKLWRKQVTGEKWRWILQDTDFAWGYKSEINSAYDYNLDIFFYLLDPVGNPWPNPPEGTFLFRTLIQNTTFRDAFRTRYLARLTTTFEQSRLLGIVDGIRDKLYPEMDRQVGKWQGQFCGMIGSTYYYPSSVTGWGEHVARLRTYVENRTAAVTAQVNHHFPTSGGLVTTCWYP